MKPKKHQALLLLSGGLDSLLAAKILLAQNIKVFGLIFKSCFFSAEKSKSAAEQLGIPYQVIDFSEKHLKIIKNPPHGRGKAANPCIDCHLLMLKHAKKLLEKGSFNFVATGEVLGERPFSQNKQALDLIAKESGLKDRLLRPLSAKLFSPTLPEKKGWVNRDKLMAIQGRQRHIQIKLAKKYKLTYPQPAGGCILCEPEFAKKLFELFDKWPKCSGEDIKLLFLGRHFWHPAKSRTRKFRFAKASFAGRGALATKIVLGKNEEENEKLAKLAQKGNLIIEPANFPGPTALIRGEKITSQTIKKAKSLILTYSKKQSTSPTFSETQK